MCGRYFFQMDTNIPLLAKLQSQFDQFSIFDFQTGEVFPSQKALVLIKGEGQDFQPSVKQWGIPSRKGPLLINARMEGIETKFTFRPLLENRCVILANGFYEWMKQGSQKDKFAICRDHGSMMYMAGIYTMDHHFVIVTGESYGEMAAIHKRTPILMNEIEMIDYLQGKQPCIVNNDNLTFQKVK